DGSHGELGDGAHAQQTHPVAAHGVAHAVQIVAGEGFSCARLEGGVVRCWGGANPLRALGEAARAPIGAIRGATSIAANGSAMCAAVAGVVRCFDVFASAPTGAPDVHALHGHEVAVTAGLVPHFANGLPAASEPRAVVCALAQDGTVMCGGDGDHG